MITLSDKICVRCGHEVGAERCTGCGCYVPLCYAPMKGCYIANCPDRPFKIPDKPTPSEIAERMADTVFIHGDIDLYIEHLRKSLLNAAKALKSKGAKQNGKDS